MRAVLWSLVAAVVGTACLAAAQAPQIEVRATFVPERAVLGTPLGLRVSITNNSAMAVRVPRENHLFLVMRWEVEADRGALPPRHGYSADADLQLEQLEPGGTRTYEFRWGLNDTFLPRVCMAGTHRFSLVIDGERSGHDRLGWTGRAPLSVEVSEPSGVDLEAYRYLVAPLEGKADVECPAHAAMSTTAARSLLARFPTSTYAAYRVRERGGGVMSGNQLDALVQQLGRGIERCGELWVPCDRPCDEPAGLMTLHGRDVLTWREKWFNLVLQAHPDIWFADEMRLRLALDRYIAGDVPGAVAAMEALGKDGRPEVAAKAREVLALLRARGMIR